MMSDDELTNLSYDVDDALMLLSKQYGITPFMLSSIILGRLAVMNKTVGSLSDWNRLVRSSLNTTENINENREQYH